MAAEATLLGDYTLPPLNVSEMESVFEEFQTADFKNLSERQKGERVSRALLTLIQGVPGPAFLLPLALTYMDRIAELKILDHYALSTFELWLNQFSELSPEENYSVRGHIVGKWVPRDEYQTLFPVGMGKTYPGSHFVTAHASPDLDTTVASFWGWVDAFGARVGQGLHIWNVPGGPPPSQIEVALLFEHFFGKGVFQHAAKTRASLSLSGLDLLSQKGVVKRSVQESAVHIDPLRNQNAVVLVDERGFYLGDWRSLDMEGVRQVIMLLNQCLRWFENYLHLKLIALFARENLSVKELPPFIRSLFGTTIGACEPAREFSEKQTQYVQDYLVKVLGVKRGMDSTFEEFSQAMKDLSIYDFQEFIDLVEAFPRTSLFDQSGYLVENRPRMFHYLERMIKGLDRAIQSVRTYVERVDVALSINMHVFGYQPHVVSYRADVEEIRSKMGVYPYLTVTAPDRDGKMNPLGVIHASDLHKSVLGTVTLRDFCNREETKIPSYLEVISVIDHHKSALGTLSPPVVLITDSQSSNALVAEMAFQVNDRYSLGGMSVEEIAAQIAEVQRDLSSPSAKRVMQRLLQRQLVAANKAHYFVDVRREYIEYLHCLYAILDDTDLLTKVTRRDIECVASLVNRLKSLSLRREVEVVAFDDIPRDRDFVRKAASRILQNREMYSLYRKIYLSKEQAIEENLKLCIQGQPSTVFADTKEQNGCCRVGQTKMFSRNFPIFLSHAGQLRSIWYEEARHFYKEHNEVDLYLHMISTVAGAEELFAGKEGKYDHQDELWLWIPDSEQAVEHLKSFLNTFQSAPQVAHNDLEIEFLGDNAKELDQLFSESFLPAPRRLVHAAGEISIPMAVIRFNAGTINSRKAVISPCLPRLMS